MPDPIDQHSFICALKDLALSLGRTPTRNEFLQGCPFVNAKDLVSRYFGGYTQFIHAAGLDPVVKQKKITNAVFEKSVSAHLEQYEPIEIIRKPYPTIAIISDVHFPFESQRVLNAFYDFLAKHPADYVIANGDMADFYSFSRFPKSHNIFTPREEIAAARTKNEEFWKQVKLASPKSSYKQLLGNHCIRPMRQMLENFPVAEDWILDALKKQFTFDGVETIFDPREELMIGDIMIHHGFRTQLGAHRDFSLYNCIVGHTHKPGVVYRNIRGGTIWELNSGYAGDPQSKGLSYTPQKCVDWVQSFAYVWPWGPQVIPA